MLLLVCKVSMTYVSLELFVVIVHLLLNRSPQRYLVVKVILHFDYVFS